MQNLKMTLAQFGKLVNSYDEWQHPLFSNIIKENGWVDESGEQYGLCSDGVNRLEYKEDGEVVMFTIPEFIPLT